MSYGYNSITKQGVSTSQLYPFPNPDCYIYLHHVDTKIILPNYGEANSDSIKIDYRSQSPLMRSAPIYSYANSGPRSLQVRFDLHRDELYELNRSNLSSENQTLISDSIQTVYNENTGKEETYVDYADLMAKQIQAAALPVYQVSSKMVNPPLVSLKLGNEIFIKGVVSGGVGVAYGLPVLANGKYSQISIDFSLVEVIPYDATQVMKYGSYRGISTTLDAGNTYTPGTSITHGALAGNTY